MNKRNKKIKLIFRIIYIAVEGTNYDIKRKIWRKSEAIP